MEVNIPKDAIVSLFDKLAEKIFAVDNAIERVPFKVHFNKRIRARLRNVVFEGLLSRPDERGLFEDEQRFNMKERLCVVGYKLKAFGLANKAKRLENLVSALDFSPKQSSVYTGHVDAIQEVEAIAKILLALSNEAKMLTRDACEVWRRVDHCYQMAPDDEARLDSSIGEPRINIDYELYPSKIFEASPAFGIPKKGFEDDSDSLQLDIFSQEPGSCGMTKWFGAKTNDLFTAKTRRSLYSALIHSRTSDMQVKLELPELSNHQDLGLKRIHSALSTEDEGFEDASDECGVSISSAASDDSGVHGLEVWDAALKLKPSRFYTWEGRNQVIRKSCKPYLTEAGAEILNSLCDMKMAEASFLINSQPQRLRYLEMKEFIRDCLMVLIGVPSETFQLQKTTASFHVSTTVRLSGCSPDSLQNALTGLAEIGTNYFRLNKFTTCQRHSTLMRSSVLRAFNGGLRTYLQKYRQSVITVQDSDVQSVLDLSTKFRKQAYELKFLSDICMCPQGFAAEYGKPKPKFPVGIKLLSYLYELCLRNMNSGVANLLLFLLKVSCAPYLRYIQQWVFKGKCIDLYKEFMIIEHDVYLAYRDKHYWTNGYTMSGADKMEGVPIFLKDLSKDMFVCGKSINLLKLCSPEHYICTHDVEIPVMAVAYSLSALRRVSDSSREYANEMKKLQEETAMELERKKNEEKYKQEQLLMIERQKANKVLAEMQELVEKAKRALAEKKKEELNFLKQQMEEAINRKALERRQADEVDARIARTALGYEVTTAKVDDELAEQARQELILYYEKLTKEAELREARAVWLARRNVLKNERDKFLAEEKDALGRMRSEMTGKRMTEASQSVGTTGATGLRNTDYSSVTHSSHSTVQDIIYNSESAPGPQSRVSYPRVGQAMQSSAQELIYQQDMVPRSSAGVGDAGQGTNTEEIDTKVSRATDSTIQDLLYPDGGSESINFDGTASVPQSRTSAGDYHGRKTVTKAMESTVQNLLYHSSEDGKVVQPPSSGTASSDGIGGRTVIRATDSTAQDLMYHSSEMVPYRSTRGVGAALQSTIQTHMYGDGSDTGIKTISNRPFEPPGEMKGILYEHEETRDTQVTTSRGSAQSSVMKGILYPGAARDESNAMSTRGHEPASTVKAVLYPDGGADGGVRLKSTRGSSPGSTIQNLMYGTTRVTAEEEPERPQRAPLTHEDVWLATQFEPLPDNFDILDEEPFGDIFARMLQNQPGVLNQHESIVASVVDESLDDENDACDVLCLPAILHRCVLEPIVTQIDVVNSAVVRYFIDNLKLVTHFETLKKFLLMEDGEFSFSLTQQLFEKVSSGVTPKQLCCISTLNSIMAQAIQSSVYACQSDNTRSLSFVLKSIPDIFKRNDVKVFDFIELRYKIQWPVNIIITENCITKYNRIFAFMLRLKRTAWVLQDIRYSLKRVDKSASNSPQLRKIHLFRHEMSHFVNDVQGYISNQILHVSWQEFLNSLEHNVRSLDDLHDCHADYLNKSLFQALLNKKAAPVMKIITDLFTKVLKFHTQLVSSSWHVDPSSSLVVHPGFSLLCTTYESFNESTCFLLTVITKLVKRGYQPHLEELLLRLNFNSYYGKNISSETMPSYGFEV